MRFKLEFPEAIQRWDEAVPLGNGQTGCLIWGPSKAVRFSLEPDRYLGQIQAEGDGSAGIYLSESGASGQGEEYGRNPEYF